MRHTRRGRRVAVVDPYAAPSSSQERGSTWPLTLDRSSTFRDPTALLVPVFLSPLRSIGPFSISYSLSLVPPTESKLTHTSMIWEISPIAIVHFTKGTLEYNALKSFMKKKNLTALGCEINSFAPPGVNHISKRMIFNEIRDGNQRLSHDIKDVKDSIDGVKDVLEKILARLDSLAEDRHRDHSPRRSQKKELQ